ncbi:MAG TPA: RNase adapter RapZ [Aeromicrobium sp.]|nr:RNase adapter RapZ [Aeromicrobium sp.]
MSEHRRFVLVTGMTGAGRTTAAKVLEKLDYYVVDNIPPQLLPATLDLLSAAPDIQRIAVVIDARSRGFFGELTEILEQLRTQGYRASTLYLEAADDVLVRRQEAARRPHPLSVEGRLMDGFRREREALARIRGRADIVIDTTNLNTHQLKQRVRAAFEDTDIDGMRATVVTFGFKYGVPIDADVIADLRFLPNPFWIDELRPQSGLDAPVRDYVLGQDRATEFLTRYEELVSLLTDGFLHEDKHFLTIGFGCTGGRHRSVAMAEAFGARLRERGVSTLVVHRDLGRE